jgi:hypothetical protein
MTPPAIQDIFLSFDATWRILNIFYMNYAFDLTQNILVPIGPVVSEENIKIQKVNDRRTDDGRPVVANAHMTLRVR